MMRDKNGRFVKGNPGVWKGRKRSQATKDKISRTKQENPLSKEARLKISESTKRTYREGRGFIPGGWNKGLTKLTDERVRRNGKKISEAMPKGKGHHSWNKNASYRAIHSWIRAHKPKLSLCEECYESKPLDVANISGKYKRDINDYKWICRKCHMKSDGRYEALKKGITKGIHYGKKG